jgi:CMP-N,N'-diacetyllegionaminic acid synthase
MNYLSDNPRVLVLIPARSGSSLRDKNLYEIGRQSLLERAIRGAHESRIASQILVSSDSSRYLDVAKELGADVHLRSHEASGDDATAQSVLDEIGKADEFDYLVYLQPTSPLRRPVHIVQCLNLALENPGHGVVSVTSVHQHPRKMLRVDTAGILSSAFAHSGSAYENRQSSTSDLVYPNGAVYVMPSPGFGHFTFGEHPELAYQMTRLDSIDVDTLDDLALAEMVLSKREL